MVIDVGINADGATVPALIDAAPRSVSSIVASIRMMFSKKHPNFRTTFAENNGALGTLWATGQFKDCLGSNLVRLLQTSASR